MHETALVKACQKGDKQAFEDLIRMFYPYVSKFLLKTTCDESLSQDLTQETFLKMIRSIDKFDVGGKAGFGTWLITIAKNCYIDHMRRHRVYLENIDDLQIDDSSDVAEETIQKMRYEEAMRAIATLPPEQSIAIRLKYIEDMTLAEIAQQSGVPAKTIKSRIHDGTVKLRRMLNPKERTDSDE